MKKFKAETASTNIDQDGDQFSESDLKEMQELSRLPQTSTIILNFDSRKPVGKVVVFEIKGVKATVSGWIDSDHIPYKSSYVVPYGRIKRDENGKIEEFVLLGFGCVEIPTDDSLTPIEYID